VSKMRRRTVPWSQLSNRQRRQAEAALSRLRDEIFGTPQYVELPWCPGTEVCTDELAHIEKATGMTPLQAVVFEGHLLGRSNCEIGRKLGRHESTIRQHLAEAVKKYAQYPNRGVISAMADTFGLRAVRDYLADHPEANTARSRAKKAP
jgi:DNA-binding NarL/FixJ family response regulator